MATGRSTANLLRVPIFDLDDLKSTHNAVLAVTEATKHPSNPVLPTGDLGAWDSSRIAFGGTVRWDARLDQFRLWYTGNDVAARGTTDGRRMGYAESSDGVGWDKPDLGLHEFNGSFTNNLIAPAAVENLRGSMIGGLVSGDPTLPYTLVAKRGSERTFWHSPDGLQFTPEAEPFLRPNTELGIAIAGTRDPVFDVHQWLYDPDDPNPARRFKAYAQFRRKRDGRRQIGLAFSSDGRHWSPATTNPVLDPNDGNCAEIHFATVHRYAGWYVMLYEFGWYEPLRGRFASDLRLAVSPDGEHFRRVNPSEPVVRRGASGAWDSGFLVTLGSAVISRASGTFIYYTGQSDVWNSWPGRTALGFEGRPGFVYPGQIGLATLPPDGFTSIRSADRETPAVISTYPIDRQAQADRLWLSTQGTLPGRSWISVEILRPDGSIFEGYEESSCRPIRTDGPDQPVVWQAGDTLPDHPAMALRFRIYGDARLHAYVIGPA